MKAFNKKYYLSHKNKNHLVSLLSDHLKACIELDFAYLHGSFLNEEKFGDIDIAVYLTKEAHIPQDFIIKFEIDLEVQLEKLTGYPVDVRVLNNTPLSFRYNVLKNGKLLFARDEDSQADFAAGTIIAYIDFTPYRKRYLKEVLGLEI